MIIKLDDNWRIEADSASWNLLYEKVGDINPDTGKPMVSRDVAYYPTLATAFYGYLDKTMKDTLDESKILDEIKRVEKVINEQCSKIKVKRAV